MNPSAAYEVDSREFVLDCLAAWAPFRVFVTAMCLRYRHIEF
jgi:hypothetical protein